MTNWVLALVTSLQRQHVRSAIQLPWQVPQLLIVGIEYLKPTDDLPLQFLDIY